MIKIITHFRKHLCVSVLGIFLFGGLATDGPEEDFTVDPVEPATATIELTLNWLGVCEINAVEGYRPMYMTVMVDYINANGEVESNWKTKSKNIDNDNSDFTVYRYENFIEVPTEGSYAVRVRITSSSGFSCCPNNGIPLFEGSAGPFVSRGGNRLVPITPIKTCRSTDVGLTPNPDQPREFEVNP